METGKRKRYLNDDSLLQILYSLHHFEDILNFCKLRYTFCRNYAQSIAKHLLKIYSVDYTDPNNFIYVYNNKNIENFKDNNGYWKYTNIFNLYFKDFYEKTIDCEEMGITSFPIYPNLVEIFTNDNRLTSFPIQPNMKVFEGEHNRLTSFPIQPNMTHFDGDYNRLTSFPIQPNMKIFRGNHNRLTSFPIQPKMVKFFGNDNQLTEFPIQPNMQIFFGNSNHFTSFKKQPKMKVFYATHNPFIYFFVPQSNLDMAVI